MAARPATVSQTEIQRTLKATLSAGLRIGRVEVDRATGRVVVFPEGSAAQAAGPDPDELLR